MIGPVVKIDPASLPQRANIHWLGGKSYEELPGYLCRLGCRLHALRAQRGNAGSSARPRPPNSWRPACRSCRRRSPTWSSLWREGPGGDRQDAARESCARSSVILARPKEPWLAEGRPSPGGRLLGQDLGAMDRLMAEGLGDVRRHRRQRPVRSPPTPPRLRSEADVRLADCRCRFRRQRAR